MPLDRTCAFRDRTGGTRRDIRLSRRRSSLSLLPETLPKSLSLSYLLVHGVHWLWQIPLPVPWMYLLYKSPAPSLSPSPSRRSGRNAVTWMWVLIFFCGARLGGLTYATGARPFCSLLLRDLFFVINTLTATLFAFVVYRVFVKYVHKL